MLNNDVILTTLFIHIFRFVQILVSLFGDRDKLIFFRALVSRNHSCLVKKISGPSF